MVAKRNSGKTLALGARLRQLRERQGISVRKMAAKVGISAGFLSFVERGRAFPSDDVVRRLARELGENPDVVLAEKSSEKISPEIVDIMNRHPREFTALVLAMRHSSSLHFVQLVKWMRKAKCPVPLDWDNLDRIGKPAREFIGEGMREPVPEPGGKQTDEKLTPAGRRDAVRKPAVNPIFGSGWKPTRQ
jgi:transcriptional regulator with XRE-family HTH domain